MSKSVKTGVYSQSLMPKRSFNFKPEIDELFSQIHETMELMNGGEKLNKTEVMEQSLLITARYLADAESKAMKQHRMQTPEP